VSFVRAGFVMLFSVIFQCDISVWLCSVAFRCGCDVICQCGMSVWFFRVGFQCRFAVSFWVSDVLFQSGFFSVAFESGFSCGFSMWFLLWFAM